MIDTVTSPLPIKQLYSKSLAISPLILYTIVMLKERNGKTDRLYKKITKSFEKALDIKYRIGQNSQLHSFTASQLHSFTAEGSSCPNNKFTAKYTSNSQTTSVPNRIIPLVRFFYITPFNKPQGTQSVELRSTSQRIIKECLTKPS